MREETRGSGKCRSGRRCWRRAMGGLLPGSVRISVTPFCLSACRNVLCLRSCLCSRLSLQSKHKHKHKQVSTHPRSCPQCRTRLCPFPRHVPRNTRGHEVVPRAAGRDLDHVVWELSARSPYMPFLYHPYARCWPSPLTSSRSSTTTRRPWAVADVCESV